MRHAPANTLTVLLALGMLGRMPTLPPALRSTIARVARRLQDLAEPATLPMMPMGDIPVPCPARAYPDDVGLDLRAAIAAPVILAPGSRATIPTGWAVEIPMGYEGQIRPRSGHTMRGLVAVLGTVDPNYRGELRVTVENHAGVERVVNHLDRIAQLVIAPVVAPRAQVVSSLSPSTRGARGFGSSGR